eukprot:scaffold26639_cov37-Phaeocystis_antarctica.AAC.1
MAPWLGLARVPLLVQRLRGHTIDYYSPSLRAGGPRASRIRCRCGDSAAHRYLAPTKAGAGP